MKTPIQELLDYTTNLLHTFDSEQRVAMAVLDYLKTNKRAMLEKEKKVMCGFGENVRGAMLKSDKHRTTEEVYNETFKTKEK